MRHARYLVALCVLNQLDDLAADYYRVGYLADSFGGGGVSYAKTHANGNADVLANPGQHGFDRRGVQVASGYVYYVSLKGVTGAGNLDTAAVEAMLPRIRQHVSIPVGVGFGIRDAATAKAVGKVADAVVIGSKIIQLIENAQRDKVAGVAQDFLADVRLALNS